MSLLLDFFFFTISVDIMKKQDAKIKFTRSRISWGFSASINGDCEDETGGNFFLNKTGN